MVPGTTPAVEYTWAYQPTTATTVGFDRLVEMVYPARPETPRSAGRVLSFGYGSGLDRFGRVKDLAFGHPVLPDPLLRHQYTYDAAGNRTSVRLRRGGAYQNARSHYYAYDGLQRLIEAQKDPQLDANGVPEYSEFAGGYSMWNLDILGNWTGHDDQAGRLEIDGDFYVPVFSCSVSRVQVGRRQPCFCGLDPSSH